MSMRLLAAGAAAVAVVVTSAYIAFAPQHDTDSPPAPAEDPVSAHRIVRTDGTASASPSLSTAGTVSDPVTASDETASITPRNRWLSKGTTALGAELYRFVETRDVAYIATGDYPFDRFTERQLRDLAQSGRTVIFDNTQPYRLSGVQKTAADIIADYYGAASDGDAIIATSVPRPNGGADFMVLPLEQDGTTQALAADVKAAVALLEAEKAKRRKADSPG